jgi:hypothetical protein
MPRAVSAANSSNAEGWVVWALNPFPGPEEYESNSSGHDGECDSSAIAQWLRVDCNRRFPSRQTKPLPSTD